jgi:DNA-binding MarR family transcriptional regulator
MSKRLSYRQYTILYDLVEEPAPSKMELIRRHYQGPGHAASYATLDRLERRGLIETKPGATKRAVAVEITDAGRALVAC